MGFMNAKVSPHYGDVEYTTRMRKAGWNLFIEPSAYVWCQPNTIPSSMKSLPKRELVHELFMNRRSQLNLMHMFKIRWYSAPSKWIGMIAFGITMIRLGLKWAGIGGDWPNWPDKGADNPVSKNG
jgi:GT2 family glycosyltransferase